MIKGKTESGFEFSINEGVKRDKFVLKNLAKMQNDSTAIFPLIDRMVELGLDESALDAHCTGEDGIVDIVQEAKEITQIFECVSKNS